MELEAGLAEGPRTATTPLDMIWHTGEANKGGESKQWWEKACFNVGKSGAEFLKKKKPRTSSPI